MQFDILSLNFLPTPHGAGVRLWGTQQQLHELYEFIGKFWNPEPEKEDDVELIVASFSYDVRKAMMGCRTCAKKHPVTGEPGDFYAVEITWTHMAFYLACLRYGMRSYACSLDDTVVMHFLEDSLFDAIKSFAPRCADEMRPYLDGIIWCLNPYLMEFMEEINYEHLWALKFDGPKTAFRSLALDSMPAATYGTFAYRRILGELTKAAKRLGCEIKKLTRDYDRPPYDFKW